MGKKKDKEKSKFRASPFDYMEGGRISEMGERYGVDKSDYNVNYGRDQMGPGGSKYKGGREEYEKAIQDAAMRDYDTRRTMEAQAMSGKKKARKYAEGGFNNIEDVIKANNMRERWHKKAGNGGSFSSASDFAGQTMRAVERERKNFIADNDAKYASKTDLEDLQAKQEAAPKGGEDPVPEESERLKTAKERTKSWVDGGSGAHDPTPYGDAPDDEQASAAVMPSSNEGAAQSYLEGFKKNLKERANFKGDF